VLDIYSFETASHKDGVAPTLLFVHGGMWLRGSKEQQTLSMYDVASHVASQAYQTLWQDSPSQGEHSMTTNNKHQYSNLGLCLAQHGGRGCIMNYRLAGTNTDGDDTGHPHQVMDVARAIAFLISDSVAENTPLHLYVGGHSAGSHLAALVLSDPQYLRMAMQERELDYYLIWKVLKGYIGVSGVYNLRRLAMSPLKAVTIGPAFFRGKEDSDVTLDASPVQVLLRAHDSIQKYNIQTESALPPLVSVPILLLNAESDFHLAQDATELLTALDHFTDSLNTDETPTRCSVIISNRNHLSIMREFGRGLIEESDVATEDISDQENWSIASLFHQSREALTTASAYLSPYFVTESKEEVQIDEASACVVEFMRLR